MSYVDEIFERCNVEKLSSFILYGAESVGVNNEGYKERLHSAFKKIEDFLNEEYPVFKEREEKASIIYQFGGELETVYMEIGLQAGIILATQIFGNKKASF